MLPGLENMTTEPHQHIDEYRYRIYKKLAPTVRKLLRQYGKDPEMREDLMGEIYCMFCYHLERYDNDRGVPLLPYLATQIRTSVHTYARRHWRTTSREVQFDWDSCGSDLRFSNDPTPGWADKLIRDEMVSALPRALGRLSKRQRSVVLWRLVEDRTFEDIAQDLEVATTTARSLLRHGLNNLRSHVKDIHSRESPYQYLNI
jgi:RNA polymerase sigma factor (sigma-70 family)